MRPALPKPARILGFLAGVYALIGGAITLVGWAFDLPRLTDWFNHGISMFPNAAACAMLSGAALLVFGTTQGTPPWRVAVHLLAGVTAAVGGLTLFENVSGLNLGIDTLLVERTWGQRSATAPMRMGVPASITYLILGSALILATQGARARRVAAALAILAVLVPLFSLIGYWYGADQLFGIARFTAIARQTSLMLVMLGIAMVAAVPEHGIAAALRRDDAGGAVLRWLLAPIVVLPLVFGWLRVYGEQADLYDSPFGTAIETSVEMIFLFTLLWWTASRVSRHSQVARQAEQSLREADRRKDEFLATLAHELRNPLAPIRSAAEVLRLKGLADPDLESTCRMIDRQAQHMARLVDDLLDVSRITSGRLELRKERVELAVAVEAAVETSRPLIDAKRHELIVTLPPEPIRLEADLTRLAQVFSNLLNNAAKYMDHGGRISLMAHREGSDAVVSIRDHGIGIPGEMLDRVFNLFAQVDQSLDRSQGGLGIGLTLTKRLVEMHGGSIKARSPGKGEGSEFLVRLPIVIDAPPVPQPRPSVVPLLSSHNERPAPRRILVVDDNRDAAASLADLLKLMGSETRVANDGIEAVQLAEAFQPDMILLDIGLPEMSGYEVCRAIRAQPWGRAIQMVAVTGWGQDEDRRKSEEAGFDKHLVKPVDVEMLKAILADASTPNDRHATPSRAASPAAEDSS